MADENSGSLFFPLPSEEPAKPAPDAPSPEQTKPADSGAFFVPVDQFKERMTNTNDSEDQRKAAISGVYEGITRLPAAGSNLIRSGIDEIQYWDLKRQQEAGKIPSADEAFADYKLAQEQAAAPFEKAKEKFSADWEKSKAEGKIPSPIVNTIDSLNYEPKTYAGALAKEGIASGTESVVYRFLGTGNALMRAGAGALSGVLGEGMRQKFEGTPYEPYAQFAGAFGGQILGDIAMGGAAKFAKGYKLWGAEKELNDALTDALQYDIKNNLTKLSPEELKAKLNSKEPINVGEVLSPDSKTLTVLQDLAGNVPGKKSNEMVAQKLGELSTSKILNGGELQSTLKEAAKDEADRVFDIARSNPAANNIKPSDIGVWVTNPKIQRIMNDVSELSGLPTSDKGRVLKVPEIIPGQPGTETKILQTERGLKELPGMPSVPEQHIGGNLNFWQKVKERLGDEFARTGETAYLDAKNELISALKKKVPEYGEALDATAAKFGDLSAMQNGYRLMGDINALKIEDILSKTKGMNESQLANLRDGAIARLNEVAAESNGVQKLYNGILSGDSKLSQKMKAIFGDDYNQVAGSIIQQSVLNKAAGTSDRLLKMGEKVLEQKGYALGAASGISALAGYMAGADVSTNSALIGLGMLLGGRQMAMNSLEKKVAPLALEAIRNPDGGRKLMQLMEANPQARTLVDKIGAGFVRATLAGGRSVGLSDQESAEPLQSYGMPSANANGGRIAYKSGGRVKNARSVAQVLLREIDQTRKLIGKKTEDILSLPDDAVATALNIARGNV